MLTEYADILLAAALATNGIIIKEFTEGVETMKLTRFIENVGWDPHCNPTVCPILSRIFYLYYLFS